MIGPPSSAIARFTVATSASKDVRGSWTAVTLSPRDRNSGITFDHDEPSAQAPCTRMMFETPSPSDELPLFSDVRVKSIGMAPALLRAKLPECAQPILHMEGFRDLPVTDRLDVDRHHTEALARVRDAEQLASRRARDLAAHDRPIADDEHFLDVELHVGN